MNICDRWCADGRCVLIDDRNVQRPSLIIINKIGNASRLPLKLQYTGKYALKEVSEIWRTYRVNVRRAEERAAVMSSYYSRVCAPLPEETGMPQEQASDATQQTASVKP